MAATAKLLSVELSALAPVTLSKRHSSARTPLFQPVYEYTTPACSFGQPAISGRRYSCLRGAFWGKELQTKQKVASRIFQWPHWLLKMYNCINADSIYGPECRTTTFGLEVLHFVEIHNWKSSISRIWRPHCSVLPAMRGLIALNVLWCILHIIVLWILKKRSTFQLSVLCLSAGIRLPKTRMFCLVVCSGRFVAFSHNVVWL
jgi:hypothetical protein